MNDLKAQFALLKQTADPVVAAAIELAVEQGEDHELNRINALDFSKRTGLDEERVISGFLHASRLGLFDLSWNVLCPGCGGVLGAHGTLKSLSPDDYHCGLCACGYEASVDEQVEVAFGDQAQAVLADEAAVLRTVVGFRLAKDHRKGFAELGQGGIVLAAGRQRQRPVAAQMGQVEGIGEGLLEVPAHHGAQHPFGLVDLPVAQQRHGPVDVVRAGPGELDRIAAQAAVALIEDLQRLRPAILHAYADHRMAHFAALLALRVRGVVIDDIACTSKTMPRFPQDWAGLIG